MNSLGKDKVQKDYTSQNRLVVFTAIAGMSGFIFAMYLGAFSKSAFLQIPPWLSAMASILATAISAIAVFLVAKTLRATRETLEASREMANDQRRIGDAQTRPYLLIKSNSTSTDSTEDLVKVLIEFNNFGNTPATAMTVSIFLEGVTYEEFVGEPEPVAIKCLREQLATGYEAVVPQNSTFVLTRVFPRSDLDPNVYYSLSLDWKYYP